MRQTGFFHDPSEDTEQWVFGATSQIEAPVLEPDRDWRPYLPSKEIQNKLGYDPLDCASHNTLTAVEILLRRVLGIQRDYSDRRLAYVTGTYRKGGNDPHYVAEVFRASHEVQEALWPYSDNLDTVEKFYATPPSNLTTIALNTKDIEFKHDTIRGGAEEIWEALKYSPVCISVNLNSIDENGYYHKVGNVADDHWTVIVHGEHGEYFELFDSAEPITKKLRWDVAPQLAKRYSIKQATSTQITLMQRAIALLKQFLALVTQKAPQNTPVEPPKMPVEAPSTPEPIPESPKVKLDAFCLAIQSHEGWYPGSRSYRNKNPGNLRSWPTQIGTDGGFAVFASYDQGFSALKTLVRNAMAQKGSYKNVRTIKEFFDVYAPSSDGNSPTSYAAAVAKRCGVLTSFELKNLS
mgnify:CR=1 FL=1